MFKQWRRKRGREARRKWRGREFTAQIILPAGVATGKGREEDMEWKSSDLTW